MISKIRVMSQREIEQTVFDEPVAVISITSPNSLPANIFRCSNVVDILFLQFHDLDPEALKRNGVEDWELLVPNCMTDEQADKVVKFVEEIQVETLIVNCEAGISRSRGVAASLCNWFRLDDSWLYKSGAPNAWCKKKVREALYRSMANE